MEANYEVKAGMQMANTTVDAVSRVLASLIDATADHIHNAESGNILKSFKKYVENGGKLLAIPVSAENTKDFEAYLESSGIMAYKTEIVRERGTMQYLFRDKDASAMEQIILNMRAAGKEILKSSRCEYGELSNYGEGMLHAASFKNMDQVLRLELLLDSYQIPHAKTMYLDRTEIAIASKDHEILSAVAEYETYARAMKPTNQKITLQEARESIKHKKEKAEEPRAKEKSTTKNQTRKE